MRRTGLLVLLFTLQVGEIFSQCNSLPDGSSCQGQDDNMYEDPEECSNYYQCKNGCAILKTCERDFLFDSFYGYCNYPFDVNCGTRPCENQGHCFTTTKRPTTTTTADCGHWAECSELGEGDGYFPDPYNCRKYWHCYDDEPEHITCADGLVFDEVNIWCDEPDRVNCGDRPICDDCDLNCYEPSTPKPDCGHQLDCSKLEDGYYADDYNCRRYWQCTGGHGIHNTCDGDLLYDPDHVWCETSDKVTCGDRPICGECEEDCAPQPTGPPDCGHIKDCTGVPSGYYPDPFNCRKFWICDQDIGTHVTCDKNYLYDEKNIACDLPDRVNCGGRPVCDECDENCEN